MNALSELDAELVGGVIGNVEMDLVEVSTVGVGGYLGLVGYN